jgi:dCTP deaminase
MSYWAMLPSGVLSDSDILALREANEVFTGTFENGAVKQACYEFTIGDRLIVPSAPERERTRELAKDQEFLIPPRSTVVVKLQESFRLPNDGLARFLLKGAYFTVGVAPVNTYADPGFGEHMGIVLTNVSNDYIKLKQGQRIAKAEFEKLPKAVRKPYAGQHGFGTDHWPIKSQHIATDADLERHNIQPFSFSEIERTHGRVVAQMHRDLRYYSTKVWIQVTVTLVAFAVLAYFAGNGTLSTFSSMLIGVVSNFLTTVAFRFMPWFRDEA